MVRSATCSCDLLVCFFFWQGCKALSACQHGRPTTRPAATNSSVSATGRCTYPHRNVSCKLSYKLGLDLKLMINNIFGQIWSQSGWECLVQCKLREDGELILCPRSERVLFIPRLLRRSPEWRHFSPSTNKLPYLGYTCSWSMISHKRC